VYGICDLVTSVVPLKATANDLLGLNRFSMLDIKQLSAPVLPASGYDQLYTDLGDNLHVVNSAGFDTSLGGGRSTVLQSPSVVAHGDSITAGWLACAIAGTTLPACAYDTLLAADARSTLTMEATIGYTSTDIGSTQVFIKDVPSVPQAMDFSPIYTYLIGTNDANNKGTGSYETGVFEPSHQAMISWNAIANKYNITSTSNGGTCTNTGSWTYQAGGNGTTQWAIPNDLGAAGAVKTCPITTYGKPIYFWYYVSDANSSSTFTYNVDATGAVSVNGFSTPAIASHVTYGWFVKRVPVAAGAHTIVFTVTAGPNEILAIGTPPAQHYYNEPKVFVAGIPRAQFNTSPTIFAAYDADVQADVALLAGDGLGVYFVNVRNYLCTQQGTVGGVANSCLNDEGVADMNTTTVDPNSGSGGVNSLHPNPQGHIDLKRAFEAAMQLSPYTAPYSGNGGKTATTTGTLTSGDCAKWDANGNVIDAGAACGSGGATLPAGTVGQFPYYAAAGTTVVAHTLVAGDLPLSFTGAGSKTVSATATSATGNCAYWTGTGDLGDAGAPCGSVGGGTAFSALTSGVNTTATLQVGTGGTLGATGTGTITATNIAASGVSGLAASATTDTTNASNIASGTLPDARLASDQCTLTKYVIAYGSLTGAASLTPTSTLVTMAGTSTRICYIEISGTTSFAGTSVTAATVRLQSGAGTPLLYSPNQDIFGSVGNATNNYWLDAGAAADRTNQAIVAAFTFVGATSAALTAGSVDVVIGLRTRP
jgi:hypothetical protein